MVTEAVLRVLTNLLQLITQVSANMQTAHTKRSRVRPRPARPKGYHPVPRLGQDDDEEMDDAYLKDEEACDEHLQYAISVLSSSGGEW
jgi:hypothetical protein